MSARRSRFVGNTAALAVSTVLATVLTLVQMRILARSLAMDEFGLFASLRGLSLLISMLAANGFPQLLTRFLPEHAARSQRAAAGRLMAATLLATGVSCALLLLLVFALKDRAFAQVPASETSASLFVWFALTTVAVALKLVLYGGFNGLRRFGSQSLFETGALVLQVAWMVLEADRLTVVRLFEIVGVTSALTALAAMPWFASRLGADVPSGSHHARAATPYRSYWWGAAGLSVVALAFSDADRWVLSTVLALESLSLFHVASRIARLANRFIAVPVLAFQPEVTRVASEGRAEVVALSTRAFFKASVLASVFAAAGIIVYADDLIRLASNETFLGARTTLWLMAASIPLSAMTAPMTGVMKALDGVRRALACDLAWACVYIILLVMLAAAFGVVGAGIAQLSACTVQLILAMRLSPVRPRAAEALAALAKSLASAALAFAPALVLRGAGAPRYAVWAMALVAAFVYVRLSRRARTLATDERARLVQSLSGHGLGRGLAWWMP
ncbi:MAG TPA: lipopolysaccharide biosynthesis protein [Candidatus Krumholzibacteria bacterium]|nr:lipopolysaccharide biosynthesis protein [Candidatus Krumholzibacteria bacterium]